MNTQLRAVRPRYEFALPDANLQRLEEAKRPLEELLVRLPLLVVSPAGQLDLLACSPSLLLELAEYAEAGAGALNLGLSAVGTLMGHAAVQIEDGSVSSDSIEALGWMFGELGVVSALCMTLAARCRQARNDVAR
jgi:hypothetical protein